ncbi:unnamed protein product [Prunus armeniaca]
MRVELIAKWDTTRYMNKSLPSTGFESREGFEEWPPLICESRKELVTKYPKNRLDEIPNVHLLKFNFMWYFRSRLKAEGQILDVICSLGSFD